MKIKKLIFDIAKSLVLPGFVYLIFLIILPQAFGSVKSLYVIFLQTIIPSVMGWGLCFILTSNMWDFSIGAEMVLVAIISAYLGIEYGVVVLFIAAIVLGLAFHLITGLVYYFLQIPTIVTTIAMALVYEATGALFKGGGGFTLPSDKTFLGNPPYNIILGVICVVIAYFLYNKTRFGFHVRAIGNGENLVKHIGINVKKVRFFCFLTCGFFVGIAAVLQLCYGGSMVPMQNLASMSIVFKPMMGVFIGMTLSKFCNPIFGVFIGELTMSIVTLGMVASGLPATVQNIIIGVFLIIFLIVNNNKDDFVELKKRANIKGKLAEKAN
ncbi:ABC transporter permease [Ohessyouella blattaphilus]|uniref:ABC transporter permease n=1 Tax=Ohessyouella blattaphilus TaxID=2949333 RepID=A0ABT1EII8_9FIRM|nr:ABC transporter permease [Ohessyouella blattaphilus]MCP1110519.1 ABC transporter permease [Ohessyouella blattaphilus]MCR8563913.1 ABC transporter permease [Ohessyouella blattaphilus]MDL2249483.1 ABC transporter permease [Lachnospiraceae bacterium OttesenSCG-928-J05]